MLAAHSPASSASAPSAGLLSAFERLPSELLSAIVLRAAYAGDEPLSDATDVSRPYDEIEYDQAFLLGATAVSKRVRAVMHPFAHQRTEVTSFEQLKLLREHLGRDKGAAPRVETLRIDYVDVAGEARTVVERRMSTGEDGWSEVDNPDWQADRFYAEVEEEFGRLQYAFGRGAAAIVGAFPNLVRLELGELRTADILGRRSSLPPTCSTLVVRYAEIDVANRVLGGHHSITHVRIDSPLDGLPSRTFGGQPDARLRARLRGRPDRHGADGDRRSLARSRRHC